MNMKNLFFATFLLGVLSFCLVSCNDEEKVEDSGTGSLNLKITDAPIDDSKIKGAYVTVAEVKVDGEAMEGFTKQTIDLMAYQNGETKLLFNNNELEAGTYEKIELVLDYETDQYGESPGCFILTEDIVKHDLSADNAAQENLTFDQSFDIESNGTTDIVVDFDLRKAVKYDNESDPESDYSFVSSAELNSAVRSVVEAKAGSIEGSITQSATAGDKLIVYAYEKGEFNAEAEQQGDIKFKNAICSSEVAEDGNYKLVFLPEGEYEVHVASYDQDSEGRLALMGLIEANSLTDGIVLSDISVSANAKVMLNVNALGLL